MLARLADPYWSSHHPAKIVRNCEGKCGPGAEFKSSAQVRMAWNIYWELAYKLKTTEEVRRLNHKIMQREIKSAVNIACVSIVVDGTRFSLGQLGMLLEHESFMQLLKNEEKQLYAARAQESLDGVEPGKLLTSLQKRLQANADESHRKNGCKSTTCKKCSHTPPSLSRNT